jgi:hypothetical protein
MRNLEAPLGSLVQRNMGRHLSVQIRGVEHRLQGQAYDLHDSNIGRPSCVPTRSIHGFQSQYCYFMSTFDHFYKQQVP